MNDELLLYTSNYQILCETEFLSNGRVRTRSERVCRAVFLGIIDHLWNRGTGFDDSILSTLAGSFDEPW